MYSFDDITVTANQARPFFQATNYMPHTLISVILEAFRTHLRMMTLGTNSTAVAVQREQRGHAPCGRFARPALVPAPAGS